MRSAIKISYAGSTVVNIAAAFTSVVKALNSALTAITGLFVG